MSITRGKFANDTFKAMALMLSIVIFNSCTIIDGLFGTINLDQKNEIVFAQDVDVTVEGKEMVSKKSGESMDLVEKPIFIEAPGYVGVVIVPTATENGKIRVALKPAEKWATSGEKNRNAQHNNKIVSEIVDGVANIQRLLIENRGDDALAEVDNLANRYPNISYINFMRASCLVVVGKQELALEVLRKALTDFPEHQAGKQLYKSLTGEEYLAH